MASPRPRKERPPLDKRQLDELALRYVGRFATTRARLVAYLSRKVRERGWSGDGDADFDAIAERLGELGYIDDAAFALAKSRSLSGRGYGSGRVVQALRQAGVGEEDGAPAKQLAETERVEAALRFARRRRLGPFAALVPERRDRERAISAMIRAGHSFGLARAILGIEPGGDFSLEELAEKR